jgi:hypothetical protein
MTDDNPLAQVMEDSPLTKGQVLQAMIEYAQETEHEGGTDMPNTIGGVVDDLKVWLEYWPTKS